MKNNIEITTHRSPSDCYIEPSFMNDGIYMVFLKDPDYSIGLRYLGYCSVNGLVDFFNNLYPVGGNGRSFKGGM